MKHRYVYVPLLLACVFSSNGHATKPVSGGTIHFRGAIVQPTIAPSVARVPLQSDPATTVTVDSLIQARLRFSNDLLDYYAEYAKPNAKLVSTTYQ